MVAWAINLARVAWMISVGFLSLWSAALLDLSPSSVKTSYRREIGNSQMPVTKSATNHHLVSVLPFTRLQNETRVSCGFGERSESSAEEAAVQYYNGQTDVQPAASTVFTRIKGTLIWDRKVYQHRGPKAALIRGIPL